MNARDYLNEDYDNLDGDQDRNSRGAGASSRGPSSVRKTFNKKRSKSPQQFNGIHRRRKKKIRW